LRLPVAIQGGVPRLPFAAASAHQTPAASFVASLHKLIKNVIWDTFHSISFNVQLQPLAEQFSINVDKVPIFQIALKFKSSSAINQSD
jgi:hypothetical protein